MGGALSQLHIGRRACCLSVIAVVTLGSLPRPTRGGPISDQRGVVAMEQFLAHSAVAPPYSGSRRLEASGSGQRGWLDVQTDFTPGSGFRYQVTAEGGSGLIRNRVLRSLLDEEQRVIARGGASRVTISRDNYDFTPQGLDEEGLAVVGMRALRRDRSLIDGQMMLTAEGDLLRIEGRPAKNPSFWVTRVNLNRAYRRINGVLMPVSMDTKAQLRLLGSSTLRMTYSYSRVDDRAVPDSADGDD